MLQAIFIIGSVAAAISALPVVERYFKRLVRLFRR
jgi:hypothetical protein